MTTDNSQDTQKLNVRNPLWKWIKGTLRTSAFLALVGCNILTLTNQAFNSAISGILGTWFSIATVTSVLKSTIDGLNHKAKRHALEMDKKTKAIAHLESDRNRLRAESQVKERKISELKDTNLKSKRKMAKLTGEVDLLKHTDTANKKAVRRLGNRMIKRTYKTTAKSFATLPVEAIPVVGIAAIVADVSIDLAAACLDLSDLSKLFSQLGMSDAMEQDKVTKFCSQNVPTVEAVTQQAYTDAVLHKDAIIHDGRELFINLWPTLEPYL